MTRVDALNLAIATVNDEEAVEVLSKIKNQIARKSVSSKPTKHQVANEGVKNDIFDVLANANEGMTVTNILSSLGDATLTNQRVSALLRQMVKEERVVKEIVKGKSYFSIA